MTRQLFTHLLCALLLTGICSCSQRNTPEQDFNPQNQERIPKRYLTIHMPESSNAPLQDLRKATIDDLGTTLSAKWTEGDKASYCNLSRRVDDPMTEEVSIYTGTLTAAWSGKKTDLNGDVECTAEDFLAVVYPANNTFEYIPEDNKYSYTFPLSDQDGTLERLATHYNQQYGRAHVTAVYDKTAEAAMEIMQPLLTICKFSFIDATNGNPIPIQSLTICYQDNTSESGKYPQKGKVTVSNLTVTNLDENLEKVAAEKDEESVTKPLTITCSTEQDEVYVALLPTTAQRTYRFTVTNSSGTYSGTADAHLVKGAFVPATGLKLN